MVEARIPVTILTGFLGAGKTTLLNRALAREEFRDAAILINEFGEVSVDHLIVSAVSDDVTELADGCMCCAVRGEMVNALRDLLSRALKPGRVVIETSGLADPAPIAEALLRDEELSQHFKPARIVTVVNLAETVAQLEAYPEAMRQIALADDIILTRAARMSETDRHAAAARIATINPAAELFADPAPDEIATLLTAASDGMHAPAQEKHHHHTHGSAGSLVLRSTRTLSLPTLESFCDWLLSRSDFRLLRMKGTATTREGTYLLQAVGRTLEQPQPLKAPANTAPSGTVLVVIGEGLDTEMISDAFAGFTGQPVIDRPDRAAMEDNPLSISGFSFKP